MLFNSLAFMLFLPIVFTGYWLAYNLIRKFKKAEFFR